MGNNPITRIDPDGGFDTWMIHNDGSVEHLDDIGGEEYQTFWQQGGDGERLSDILLTTTDGFFVGPTTSSSNFQASTVDLWSQVPPSYLDKYSNFHLMSRYKLIKNEPTSDNTNRVLNWESQNRDPKKMYFGKYDSYPRYLENVYGTSVGIVALKDLGLLEKLSPGNKAATKTFRSVRRMFQTVKATKAANIMAIRKLDLELKVHNFNKFKSYPKKGPHSDFYEGLKLNEKVGYWPE
jgi:hypothetical protein